MLTILRVWLLPRWLAPPGLTMQTTTENNRNSCKNNNNNKDASPFTLQLDLRACCFSAISIGSQPFFYTFVGDSIPHRAGSSYKLERAKGTKNKRAEICAEDEQGHQTGCRHTASSLPAQAVRPWFIGFSVGLRSHQIHSRSAANTRRNAWVAHNGILHTIRLSFHTRAQIPVRLSLLSFIIT